MDRTEIKADQVVEAEACAWIAQLETGNLSREDRLALESWLERSPRHEAALRYYARQWRMADSLCVLREPMDEVLAERRRARSAIGRFSTSWLGLGVYTLCALSFLFLAGLAYVASPLGDGYRNERYDLITQVGESRELALPDGSSVVANTDSQVRLAFDATVREAFLTKGEAIFSVARDPDRPFIVHAGHQTVRAIGTEFAVRINKDDSVLVAVTEGRVELARAPAAVRYGGDAAPPRATPTAVVSQGYWATARPTGFEIVETDDNDRMERRLSWRKGVLDFSGETLDYAVQEIMRYSPYEVEIDDPQLRQMRIGGVFHMSDADELFDILEESFGVAVTYGPDDQVRLSLAEDDAAPDTR